MKRISESDARIDLVRYGRRLVQAELVQGTWGNLSVRLDDNYMLTTPSGLDYQLVKPADMVKVDIETLTYGEGRKPTSEKGLHGAIYELRKDVGAVIHAHSLYCSVFAAARIPLQVSDPELQKLTGELLYVADYGIAGSKRLAENVIKALGDRPGCIMSNHGMVCCGTDLEDAFRRALAMEEAARQFIENRWEDRQ